MSFEIIGEPQLAYGNKVVWMDTTITGPEGTWTGPRYIVVEGSTARDLWDLRGAGAYEGLTYLAWGLYPNDYGNHQFTGIIYAGPPPADLSLLSAGASAAPSGE